MPHAHRNGILGTRAANDAIIAGLGSSPDDKVYPLTKIRVVEDALRAERGGAALGPELAPHRGARYVSRNQIIDWYRAVAHRQPDPWFAYRVGQRFHVSRYGLYGFAILSCPDFRQALRFAIQYHELATPLTDIGFAERRGEAVWRIEPAPERRVDPLLYRFLVELHFGILITLHRDIMGSGFAPRELRVKYGPQGDPAAYAKVFGCRVRFRAPHNELSFDAAWLRRPAELGDAAAFAELQKLCDERLRQLRLRAGVAGQVRALLLPNLRRPLSFAAVAARLHMSDRTLRRSLKREQHSFRSIVDELRETLAMHYLRDTGMSVEEVAQAVGFGDAASFRRAFGRWTRVTPGQFRGSFRSRKQPRMVG